MHVSPSVWASTKCYLADNTIIVSRVWEPRNDAGEAMKITAHVLAGFGGSTLAGLTGVGGASLMMPLLN